jgi:hypothetical protein
MLLQPMFLAPGETVETVEARRRTERPPPVDARLLEFLVGKGEK